jgi:formate dehydrogenase major subunit
MFNLRWIRPQATGTAQRQPQPYSAQGIHKAPRLEGSTLTHGVCPYCAVGCGVNIYTKGGMLIDVEGNPESPINEGTLCPKGANAFNASVNPHRAKHVLYRAPYSEQWEMKPLDWAMDRIAELTKEARDRGFKATAENGKTMNAVPNVGTLGGAVLDNEENYIIKKFFTGGLGMLSIENQARI